VVAARGQATGLLQGLLHLVGHAVDVDHRGRERASSRAGRQGDRPETSSRGGGGEGRPVVRRPPCRGRRSRRGST
jgi:hypothetical protein